MLGGLVGCSVLNFGECWVLVLTGGNTYYPSPQPQRCLGMAGVLSFGGVGRYLRRCHGLIELSALVPPWIRWLGCSSPGDFHRYRLSVLEGGD